MQAIQRCLYMFDTVCLATKIIERISGILQTQQIRLRLVNHANLVPSINLLDIAGQLKAFHDSVVILTGYFSIFSNSFFGIVSSTKTFLNTPVGSIEMIFSYESK